VVEAQVVDDATGTLAVSGGWGLPAQILVPFGGDASNEDIEVAITAVVRDAASDGTLSVEIV
jgi:hypothetical protein